MHTPRDACAELTAYTPWCMCSTHCIHPVMHVLNSLHTPRDARAELTAYTPWCTCWTHCIHPVMQVLISLHTPRDACAELTGECLASNVCNVHRFHRYNRSMPEKSHFLQYKRFFIDNYLHSRFSFVRKYRPTEYMLFTYYLCRRLRWVRLDRIKQQQ